MSLRDTPALSTLSRLISMKRWGTLGRKVVTTEAISGRAVAAWIKRVVCSARYCGRVAGAVLDHHGKPGTVAQAGYGRWAEGEHLGLVDPHEKLPVEGCHQLVGGSLPHSPILERDKNESGIG
jgi:hypothetical protein